jgi:aldose 1-epimerase
MTHYSIEKDLREGIEIYKLIEADRAVAEIAPALGNNCFAFRTSAPILEEVSFDDFRKKPTSYGIPILFPFPNRIRDGKFNFEGAEYTVDPPRHGFVRDKAWQVVDSGASDAEGAWIESRFDAADYAEQILAQFPALFTLDVLYRLKDGRLEMETIARNTGDATIPIGFGTHPYFQHPQPSTIQVPAGKRWELADNLPTGNLIDVAGDYDLRAERSTDGLTLDDIYTDVSAEADGMARCYLNQTVVEFDPVQFPQIVVFTPPAPRRAICIEPNSCPTDAFNLQERGIESNVITLTPGATVGFKISIYNRH